MKIATRLGLGFGMGRRGEEFIIILDISAVFSSDELVVVDGVSNAVSGGELEATVAR